MNILIAHRGQVHQLLTQTHRLFILAFMQVGLTQLNASLEVFLLIARFNITTFIGKDGVRVFGDVRKQQIWAEIDQTDSSFL